MKPLQFEIRMRRALLFRPRVPTALLQLAPHQRGIKRRAFFVYLISPPFSSLSPFVEAEWCTSLYSVRERESDRWEEKGGEREGERGRERERGEERTREDPFCLLSSIPRLQQGG